MTIGERLVSDLTRSRTERIIETKSSGVLHRSAATERLR